jgi:hypothetical protein
MVTGIPLRSPLKYSSHTLDWAKSNSDVTLTQGAIQEWTIYWTHTRSLGLSESEAREKFKEMEDYHFEYQGVSTYLGAGHFQFVSPRAALQAAMPFPYVMPMGNERYLDQQINELGFLRLSLPKMYVQHLGNRLTGEALADGLHPTASDAGPGSRLPSTRHSIIYRLLDIPVVKKILLWVYSRIFNAYYAR